MPVIVGRTNLMNECFMYARHMETDDLIKIIGKKEAANIKMVITKPLERTNDDYIRLQVTNRVPTTSKFEDCDDPLKVFELIYAHMTSKLNKHIRDRSKCSPIFNKDMKLNTHMSFSKPVEVKHDNEVDIEKFWNTPNIFVPDLGVINGDIRKYRRHINNLCAEYKNEILYIKNELQMAIYRLTTEDAEVKYWTVSIGLARHVSFRGKKYFDELIAAPGIIWHIEY
jgi:hypothetical protein